MKFGGGGDFNLLHIKKKGNWMGYFMMKIHWIRLHYINILIHIGKDKCIQSPYIIISIPYHMALWNGSLVRIQFDDFYFSFMHIFLAFLCHFDGISMEFYCYILFAPFFSLLSHKGLYIMQHYDATFTQINPSLAIKNDSTAQTHP